MASILLRKTKRNVEAYGIGYTIRRILCYLIKPILESTTYRIYSIDLDDFHVKEGSNASRIFEFLEASDNEKIKQIEQMEEWLEGKLRDKLQRGGLCLVAMDGGIVAGFNLVAFGEVSIPLVGLKRCFAEDEAWSEQITVRKDYRGKGLGTEIRYRVFEELKRRGIKRLYGGTLVSNRGNLRLSRKVGLRELFDIHYLRILSRKKWDYREIRDGQQNQERDI